MQRILNEYGALRTQLFLTLWDFAYLFLVGAGNQPAQLAQAVIDSVTAPFLNNLRKDQKLLY